MYSLSPQEEWVEGLEDRRFRSCSLNLALEIATDLVGMSASLHASVSGQGSDILLDFTLDLVADTLGMGLGIGSLLGGVGLGLLLGTGGGKIVVADGLTDGLLGTADGGVESVGDSVSHVGVVCVFWVGLGWV